MPSQATYINVQLVSFRIVTCHQAKVSTENILNDSLAKQSFQQGNDKHKITLMKVGVLYKNMQIPFKFEIPNSLRNKSPLKRNSEHHINQVIQF